MDDVLQALGGLLAAQLWLLAGHPADVATTAAIGAALLALGALTAKVALLATGPGPAARAPYASARGSAPGEQSPIAQSDPDSDARPRPRAPGRLLPAG